MPEVADRERYRACAVSSSDKLRAERSQTLASAVNLKFPSHGWHARGRNFKFENHTRNNKLLVQLLNLKFALCVAPM